MLDLDLIAWLCRQVGQDPQVSLSKLAQVAMVDFLETLYNAPDSDEMAAIDDELRRDHDSRWLL